MEATKFMSGNFSILLLQITSVVIPLFSIIGIGFFFARWKRKPDIGFVTNYIIYIAAPALVFNSLLDKELNYSNFYPILASSAIVGFLGIVIGMSISKKIARSSPAGTLTVAFMNSGNMGLPACYFAFGNQGLATATIFFVAMSIIHYTFGSIIAGGRSKLKEALLLPLTPAAIIAILCNRAQVSLPLMIERPIELLADSTIPLMLFTLGVRLSNIKIKQKVIPSTLAAMRFLVGLAGGFACVHLFGIQGIQAKVVILQSTMPPAIFNFILCEKFNKEPELAATTILSGTMLSLFTIPILLYILFFL